MASIVGLPAVAATAFAFFAVMPSAHAIPRTFVSAAGGGIACTRAAPCATFQGAHDATDANGEINCIDAGDFGALAITKSITIDCAGTLGAITSGSVLINTPGVVVRLRNLTINNKVDFGSGAALFIEKCKISSPDTGISFQPPTGVTARLFVSDSEVRSNFSIGIAIVSIDTGSARATIDGVRSEKNPGTGLVALGVAGTGLVVAHVRNSVLSGNQRGITATTSAGGSVVSVTADRTSLTLNAVSGVAAQGPSAFVLLGRSTVISNNTGVAPSGGGGIFSYQNNHLTGNVTDGAPTAVLTLK